MPSKITFTVILLLASGLDAETALATSRLSKRPLRLRAM
jgi:hypothetical protein